MVYYFTTKHDDITYVIYMGKDKFENEDLIKHGFTQDLWFHVDDLSSAHIYIRLPENSPYTAKTLPEQLLIDCCQLTKANSIDGNKRDNIRIVYTPWSNLKKTGDMAVGQVSFHSEKLRYFKLIVNRENAVINRLNKTKSEVTMAEHIERKQRIESELRTKEREVKRKQFEADQLQKQQYAQDKEARDYSRLFDSTEMTSNAETSYKSQSSKSKAKQPAEEVDENGDFDFM